MSTWIALLRGVGGGIRPLPMAPLRQELERLGLRDVRTYIATGNVVFGSDERAAARLTKRIRDRVAERFGFDAKPVLLTAAELRRVAAGNPFPGAVANPTTLHCFFLSSKPLAPDLDAISQLRSGREAFVLQNKTCYLCTPEGFGRSKLASRVERLLGVDATARNWRTVTRLLELAGRP